MFNRVALGLLAVTIASAANAAPISIRCTDPKAFRQEFATYFATFEIETHRVVFEPKDVGGPTRHLMLGGPFPGTIRNANDDQIAFSVKTNSGTADLIWDRRRGQLVWAGLGGDETNPRLSHPCVVIETRTLLSENEDEPAKSSDDARPFSIRCALNLRSFYFTLNPRTKKAIMEGWHFGRYFPGEISSIEDNRIAFSTAGEAPKTDFVWDSREKTMKMEGIHGDPKSSSTVEPCTEVELRTKMALYCQFLWPGPRDPKLCYSP